MSTSGTIQYLFDPQFDGPSSWKRIIMYRVKGCGMLGVQGNGKDYFLAVHVRYVCSLYCYDCGWIISIIMETMFKERLKSLPTTVSVVNNDLGKNFWIKLNQFAKRFLKKRMESIGCVEGEKMTSTESSSKFLSSFEDEEGEEVNPFI